jgi:hypothetical protein
MALRRPIARIQTRRDGGRRLRDPGRLLEELAILANALASAASLESTYRALFDFARVVSPTSAILVSLYDPVHRLRTCVYSAREDGEDDVSTLPPMPMSGSPQSEAIDTNSPVVTSDLQLAIAGKPGVNLGLTADPRLPQSSIAVPMVVLGRTIGAFEAQSLDRAAYKDEHVVAMTMAANIAALATERVRIADPIGRRLAPVRKAIGTIIANREFVPVFQPIVEMRSRATVGYEALTRKPRRSRRRSQRRNPFRPTSG